MQDDTELLRRYLELRSEAAFAALVQRHLGLVYATALRRVGGDAQLAQDVAQTVFIALARKAPTLAHRPSLAGWLYTGARFASAAVVRREQRRRQREITAHSMETTLSPQQPETDWSKIRPVLDDAMGGLRDEDREAVLLRFFQQQSFAEIGATLRLSEDAARKRVERALDRLRTRLGKYGVVSTTSALTTALSAATADAPATLSATIAHAAVTSSSAAVASTTVGLIKTVFPAAAAIAVGTWLVTQEHLANAALRQQVQQLAATQELAAREQAENQARQRQLADLEQLRRDAETLPALQRAASEQRAKTVRSATIAVTADGRLRWGDEYVTLNRFLHELKVLNASSPDNAALIIRSEGASFNAFAYPVDEARKLGISHVIIERDTPADPKSPFSWF